MMPYPDDHRPQLHIDQPPHHEAEAAQLAQLAHLLDTIDALPDVRDLAPAVRELFPESAYQVGCGSSHIWLHRTADHQRLALIR